MISYKEDKLVHSTDILNCLWQGETIEAIGYLQEIKAKNEPSKEMLITYLTKNENTIIDGSPLRLQKKAGKRKNNW